MILHEVREPFAQSKFFFKSHEAIEPEFQTAGEIYLSFKGYRSRTYVFDTLRFIIQNPDFIAGVWPHEYLSPYAIQLVSDKRARVGKTKSVKAARESVFAFKAKDEKKP